MGAEMQMKFTTAALAFAGMLAWSGQALAQDAVTMADLGKDPAAFKGKKVVIADCMVLGWNEIVGAQCGIKPMGSSDVLVYIDSATWSAKTKSDITPCDGLDISKMCIVKVMGDVDLDSRGKALIKNAEIEILERTAAF
jgi:hypothetical protein